jgi:hypothetical protein
MGRESELRLEKTPGTFSCHMKEGLGVAAIGRIGCYGFTLARPNSDVVSVS